MEVERQQTNELVGEVDRTWKIAPGFRERDDLTVEVESGVAVYNLCGFTLTVGFVNN